MDDLISGIRKSYPKIKLNPSTSYYWSPETNEVFYKRDSVDEVARWSLLHEVGHAILGHKSYATDYQLVRLEVSAWQKALEISPQFGVIIDENHVQDCLDTYRDWIYKRSICPSCSTKSFQQSDHKHYRCFNCHMTWRVTPSRFCRAYRTKEKINLTQKVFI